MQAQTVVDIETRLPVLPETPEQSFSQARLDALHTKLLSQLQAVVLEFVPGESARPVQLISQASVAAFHTETELQLHSSPSAVVSELATALQSFSKVKLEWNNSEFEEEAISIYRSLKGVELIVLVCDSFPDMKKVLAPVWKLYNAVTELLESD